MANRSKKPQQTQPRSRSVLRMNPFWMFILVIGLMVASLPSVLLLAFGLLPTLVAAIIDRSHRRSATCCVAGMNVCGVFPYLLQLWFNNHSLQATAAILTDVFALLVIYGAAAFGWLLFVIVPPVIASFLSALSQRQLSQLRATQRKIIEEWGEGVAKSQAVQSLFGGQDKGAP